MWAIMAFGKKALKLAIVAGVAVLTFSGSFFLSANFGQFILDKPSVNATLGVREASNTDIAISIDPSAPTFPSATGDFPYQITPRSHCNQYDSNFVCIDLAPDLCPYLSMKPKDGEAMEFGFDKSPLYYSALGLLTNPGDETDVWDLEITSPCFEGECPANYDDLQYGAPLPQSMKGQTFKCDLESQTNDIPQPVKNYFKNDTAYADTLPNVTEVTAVFTGEITAVAHTPVLIIPGVLGTEIFNNTEKLWLDLARNFTDIGDQFMDPLQFDNSLLPLDTSLSTGEVIKNPNNLFDYSEGLVNELQNQGYTQGTTANDNIFLFPYDWRYGVNTNIVNELKQKIQDVKAQTGSSEVDVVAHSTGGLLVKKYVMDNPTSNFIRRAVFVGVPNTGAPKAIKVLLQGDGFGIPWLADGEMKKIAKNLPVVYDLSPSQQYFNQKGSYVKVINQGLFSVSSQDLDFNQTSSFLTSDHSLNTQALSNAHDLHTLEFDNYDLRSGDVDLYSINGCKAGTMSKVVERRAKSILGNTVVSYDRPEESPGDGTVPLESATNLPIDQDHKYYALKTEHGKMLSQDGLRQQIVNIITDSNLIIGDDLITQDISKCKLNGKAISVFSPLNINITDQDNNKAGIASDGSVFNDIPNADFEVMGEHKFVYLPTDEGQTYDVDLQGTGNGTFTLKNENIVNNIPTETEVFSNIPVTTNLKGDLGIGTIATLSLDTNGDGNIDQTVSPDGTQQEGPSLNELIVLLKQKVQSLPASDKLKQNLLKKIENLEKKIEKKKEANAKILAKFKNKITKQELKGRLNTTDANSILELLDLLEAQSENIALDADILAQLKAKIQTLNIKQNQKNDMLKRVEKLENKQKIIKTLANLTTKITTKGQNGKIDAVDAQILLEILTQIESVI